MSANTVVVVTTLIAPGPGVIAGPPEPAGAALPPLVPQAARIMVTATRTPANPFRVGLMNATPSQLV